MKNKIWLCRADMMSDRKTGDFIEARDESQVQDIKSREKNSSLTSQIFFVRLPPENSRFESRDLNS